MSNQNQIEWFQEIETIISSPLNFKARLGIGEDAYTALKVKNAVVQAWDVAGVATTAAVVAKSSAVASTFFAPSGWLAAIGIGTAVTPIGWVIAAGVVTGGAWFGITRHMKKVMTSRVTVVPNFINTPLDVLALGLFDLIAPLALKVAADRGSIAATDRNTIHDYFVSEWGYDAEFVTEGLKYVESSLDQYSVEELAQTIADFTRQNKDCNFSAMSQEIIGFLSNIVEVEGEIDQRDRSAIDRIEGVFNSANKFSFRKKLRSGWTSVGNTARRLLPRRKSSRHE